MSFPFFEHWKKRNSDIWWMFPASLSNCSFLVQRNNLRNAFSTRNLFSTFFLIEWWKFGFSWVFIRIPFKSFSLRQKWSFGERFVLSKLPGKNFKNLSQNIFGFPTNVFLRNVKNVFHMSRGIVRSFLEKECFFNVCGLWAKKLKQFGKSVIGKVVKLSLTCPKHSSFEFVVEKKNKVPLILRQGAIKISDSSTEISNRIVKLALWVTGGKI